MGNRRKKYDREFRVEAVRLASEPGVTSRSVERDLGLYQGAISHWKKELKSDPAHAFPGTGKLKPEQEELRRLRRENERLKRERDILKKAVAYFSMDAIKDTRL
jgi:transposase